MKFFRTHSKKFMAFFGVILMLAFVLPSTFRGNGNDSALVVGKIGDEKVTRDEIRTAEEGWNLVTQRVQFRRTDRQTGQEQWLPLVALLPMSQQAFNDLRQNVTAYYLLQAEARKLGMLPSQEDARQLLNQQEVGITMPSGARVDFANVGDEELKNSLLYHVANFLTVASSFQRAAEAAKISKPLVHADVMGKFQTIKSYVVDISAGDLKAAVSPPTTQQVQAQFDQFGDQEPGSTSTKDPYGFGYRYPNRVKVQYILIPLGQCTVAVRGGKSDYDWEVEAFKYYDKHAYEYATTQPDTTASAIKDFVATRPTSQAAGPTTKPFDEVKSQIVDSLITPAAARLQRQIANEISSRMEAEFATKGEIGKFEYLQKLAGEITAKYKVEPTIVAINDSFKSAADLRLLPNIGRVPSFPDFATAASEPFLPESQRGKPGVLALNQPSKPVGDDASNLYIYQITAADPGHKPANLDEVREQIVKDWTKTQAMAAATKQAQALLTAAEKTGLKDAADAAGQKLMLTGAYPRVASGPIADYPLSPRAQTEFTERTYNLLGKIKDKSNRPVALIELPSEDKVAVAEVVAVESSMSPESLEMFDQYFMSQMQQQYQQLVAADWFQRDAIVTRTKFIENGGNRSKPADEPASMPPVNSPPLGS